MSSSDGSTQDCDGTPTSNASSPGAHEVDAEVSVRQCIGAGFEKRPDFKKRTEEIKSGVLRLAPHGRWEAERLDDWTADPFSSRNWQFQHHALRWLSPVRHAAQEGDVAAHQLWFDTVRSWITENPPGTSASKYAWMDMADGMRAQELVFGWSIALTDDEQELLRGSLNAHGRWLADDSNQSSGNHALHQNTGLFVVASFLRRQDWQQLALRRMSEIFTESFDVSGANNEGSIQYHQLNLVWWTKAWERVTLEGLSIPPEVDARLRKAAEFLAHATRPDGTMTPIGDTHLRRTSSEGWSELEYASSLGTEGEAPAATAIVAPNGFVFGRTDWGDQDGSFTEQTHYSIRFGPRASHHAHQDRGAVTLYAGAKDWVTDPGSYIYEPKDSFRKYLKSREGHNVLVIEGREYDPEGSVDLENYSIDDSAHDFQLVDRNYRGVAVRRRIVFLPGLDILVVLDAIEADEAITARQLWHVEPGVKPRFRDHGVEMQERSGKRMTLNWLGQWGQPKVTYADDKSSVGWVSRAWGEKEPAAVAETSMKARRGMIAAVLGDSTKDVWAIESSRTRPTETWLRIIRFGKVWNVTIGEGKVEILLDEARTASLNQSGVEDDIASTREEAWIKQRFAQLERQVTDGLTRASLPTGADADGERIANLEARLTAAETHISEVKASGEAALVREKKRAAAILAVVPEWIPAEAILGSLTLREVVPYVEDPLYLYKIWNSGDAGRFMNLAQRRRLSKALYQRGYYAYSLEILRGVAIASGKDGDQRIVDVRGSELALLRGELIGVCEPPEEDSYHPETGRILHIGGKALPETQTGYTLRTHYLAQAQSEKGYDVHVMRQAGAGVETLGESSVVRDGVTYHLPDGPARGTVNWAAWLQANTDALRDVVEEVRPSLLHCHSDYINQLIARPVADAYGLPLIYESRGFWEESWLSRVETSVGRPLEADYQRYGYPDAYTLRHERENQARASSDHVTTLAEVMREHIIDRGEDPERISVTPNGVLPSDFPVVEPDLELKDRLDIPREVPVIGYITSVVEYEGIDTLVEAFAQMTNQGVEARLLLVGDGPVRKALQEQARNLGIAERCCFTGRIPHEEVLDYYSIIDLFVVPRKNRAVCRLVTPLKPFEAFSTGRAVVVSDVDALREIAGQSGAAATFRAEDPNDLAQLLSRLLEDPQARAEMSEKGAAWVRAERSWRSIADRYDAPYRGLDVRFFRELARCPQQAPDAEAARERRRRSHIENRGQAVELLQLHGEDGIPTDSERARQTVETGWAAYGFDPVPLDMPIDWRSVGPGDRSWRMHFHCWEFMHAPLMEWSRTGDPALARWAVDRALSWIAEFGDIDDDSTMAWYDMAIAYRTMVLITLLRIAEVEDEVTDAEYAQLLRFALRQRDAHWEKKAFNPRNNHGYYSAVSQLVLGRELTDLPGMAPLRAQGEQRLRLMTEGQFMADGGHSEHSPDYHRMLLSGFDAALAAGVIDDPRVSSIISAAADALGWMIQPDGCLVQFGDSAQRQMVDKGLTSSSPTTTWVLSGGVEGSAPVDRALVLPDTGYVFIREPQADARGRFDRDSYLAFTSAFHSRAHKHCDDNTMVWFEDGQQILCDGGRYRYGELLPPDSPLREKGFYYADPIRQYMETCGPHSTVSLDSDMHDRRREPHGSGLVSASQDETGRHLITARTPHTFWAHQRDVEYLPGQELVVLDRVEMPSDEQHEVRLWWHFDGELDLQVQDQKLVLRSAKWAGRRLEVTSEAPGDPQILHGSEEPIGGWRSRKDRVKEASWSVCWQLPAAGAWEGRTTMVFVDDQQ